MLKFIILLLAFGTVVYYINRTLSRFIRFFRIIEGNLPKKEKVHKEGNLEIRFQKGQKKASRSAQNNSNNDEYVDFEEVD